MTWRERRRRRAQGTILSVLGGLLVIGGAAYAVSTGLVGGPTKVKVTTLPTCTDTPVPPLTPNLVRVNVYNATERTGLAAKAATALDLRHFTVGVIANDPLRAKVPGTAVVRHGPAGLPSAQLVAAQVEGATLVPDKRQVTDVDLVVGAKCTALRAIAQVTPTHTAAPTCRPASPSGLPTSPPTTTPTSAPAS